MSDVLAAFGRPVPSAVPGEVEIDKDEAIKLGLFAVLHDAGLGVVRLKIVARKIVERLANGENVRAWVGSTAGSDFDGCILDEAQFSELSAVDLCCLVCDAPRGGWSSDPSWQMPAKIAALVI